MPEVAPGAVQLVPESAHATSSVYCWWFSPPLRDSMMMSSTPLGGGTTGATRHNAIATLRSLPSDGWYAGGNSASGWQVMRFNLSQNDWAQKISFDEEWTPHFLETDDVNGGFFVFEPEVLDYIDGPQSSLERDALDRIARDGQMVAYRHEGYFQPMDTLREKNLLEDLWRSGEAPWRRRRVESPQLRSAG